MASISTTKLPAIALTATVERAEKFRPDVESMIGAEVGSPVRLLLVDDAHHLDPQAVVVVVQPLYGTANVTVNASLAATDLMAGYSHAEIAELRATVPRAGLAGTLRGRAIAPLCLELIDIARQGAARVGGPGSAELLDPLRSQVAAGRCPADDILDAFHAAAGDQRRFAEAVRPRP